VTAKNVGVKEAGELGSRKIAVLRAVVEEYVRTGEPVGSETIADHTRLGVSSATIRNEMAALEELGYLTHPHTSAGRIPTDLGYRRYVDSMPVGAPLRDAQRRAITAFFAQTMLDLEEVLKGTTLLLSCMTQYAGLAVPPSIGDESIVRVELIELGPTVMILVVGQHGRVEKAVLDRPKGLDAQGLEALERKLASALRGRSLTEARVRALKLAGESAQAERELLAVVAGTLGDMQRGTRGEHVMVGGVANLADEAAHWRRETVRRLFEALEHESEMLRLLRDVSPARDVSVTIGAEHPSTDEWQAALVAAPFKAGDMPLGTIGVVGPTAMDYLTVVASVRAVAKRLSELTTELGA
jgi:heat-inducible transcriptional repressor